jgi:hypothetical protein
MGMSGIMGKSHPGPDYRGVGGSSSIGRSTPIGTSMGVLLSAVFCLVAVACTGSASTSTTGDHEAAPDESEEFVDSPPSSISRRAPAPTPDEDVGDYLVRCFAEYGIVARNLANETEIPGESSALFFPGNQPIEARQDAAEQCTAAARAAGLIVDFDDPDQVRVFYREAMVPFHECLVANDYPVPDLPTEEAFVEAPLDWDPYALMGGLTPLETSEDCPAPQGFGVVDLRGVDVSD